MSARCASTRPISPGPGIFVSLDRDGALDIERGFVRPEDEAPAASDPENPGRSSPATRPCLARLASPRSCSIAALTRPPARKKTSRTMIKPLSERLVTELAAHRTLALRNAVAAHEDVAFRAVLHALCVDTLYTARGASCLQVRATSAMSMAHIPALKDSDAAQGIAARHEDWEKRLPENPDALWEALTALDEASRRALLAHCAGLTANLLRDSYNSRPGALEHGEVLAHAVQLDMAEAGWKPPPRIISAGFRRREYSRRCAKAAANRRRR